MSVCLTSITANQKTSHFLTFICIVLLTADIWLRDHCGAICDRIIVEQLCDWYGLQQAIGWCHSHYVTLCRSLRVTRSLQHQDESDFCMLFLIESRFATNFSTAGINIMVSKTTFSFMSSVLTTNYHLGGADIYFGWDLKWKLSVCCLRSVHVITHAPCSRQHKEEVNLAAFTFLGRRNTTSFAVDKCRKASIIQDPDCVFLLICANSNDILHLYLISFNYTSSSQKYNIIITI